MSNTTKLSIAALSLVVGISACGDSHAASAAQDDFKRDLQLASTNLDLAALAVDPSLLNLMETKPNGAPQTSTIVRKGAGNRAVRSQTPTVRATPDVDVAAVEETVEEVETEAIAPVPEQTNEPVAVAPRPIPAPVIQVGSGNGDYGTSGNGGGIYGPGSGGGGVVIRGGGVDGDNCELHRRGGRTSRGPVYIPSNRGIYIGTGMPSRGSPTTFPTRTASTGGGLSRPGGMSRSRIR